MTTWTSSSIVTPMLPTGYAAVLTAQGTTLAAQILLASEIARGDLETFYHTFPDVSDDIPTPSYIQRLVGLLTAHLVHQILGRANEIEEEDNTTSRSYLAMYQQGVSRLTGMDQPDGRRMATVPRYSVTGEAMTFGTSPLGSDQYAFDPGLVTTFEIIENSVRVSGYERGNDEDFVVYYSAENRAWVLERINSGIVDGTTVSYDISWLRQVEADRADIVTWGKAVRG